MTIALVQEGVGEAQGINIDIVLTQQATVDNVLIAVISTRSSTRIALATHEYAFVTVTEVQNTTEDDWLGIYYRIVTASDPADYSYDFSDLVSDSHAGWIGEYSGLDIASLVDKFASTARTTGTEISSGTTATTDIANELAVAGIAHRLTNTVTGWTNSFVTEGHSETVDPVAGVTVGTKILTATGAIETTATVSDDTSLGVIATFMGASTSVETSGTLNGGGSITASVTKHLTQVARPTSTITAGDWDTGPTTGQTLHGYAGDDSDTTYIEDTTV
jgi:hypothetical protein